MKIETQEWIAKLLISVGVATELTPSLPSSPTPPPAPENLKYYLRAVRKGLRLPNGLDVIALSLCPVGSSNPLATLHCVSGQPGKQNFRAGPESVAGSMEPLPEGAYSLGLVEFKGGAGNFSAEWSEGLGPVWIAITPKFQTGRSALGLHIDGGAIGTAGCLAVQTLADLKVLVWWMERYKPVELVCDWQLPKTPKVDIFKTSPNASPRGSAVSRLVVHNTDCSFDRAVDWLCNPEAEASAHIVIARDGRVASLVDFNKTAWHAGDRGINHSSIGIEVEADRDHKGMTAVQEEKLIEWIKWAQRTYSIKPENIITHRTVVSTDCPGWIFPTEVSFAEWKKAKLA